MSDDSDGPDDSDNHNDPVSECPNDHDDPAEDDEDEGVEDDFENVNLQVDGGAQSCCCSWEAP